jgi:4'-phosphopantetheinyl transferase
MSEPAGLSIRLLDLDALGPALESVETAKRLLSAEERAWTAAVRPEILSRRRAARIALRISLTEAGAASARGEPFGLEAGGKPYMVGGPAFNLSHSGPTALIAIADTGPIGIDVERARKTAMELSRRNLIEAAGLALSPQRDGETDRLLASWTRLEALAKALGLGMARLLAMLDITATGAAHLSAEKAAANAVRIATDAGLGVAALPLPPQVFGAIAAAPPLIASQPIVRPMSRDEIDRFARP